MSEFKFTAEGRSALRREIVRNATWPQMREDYGLRDASQMTVPVMIDIARAMGLEPESYCKDNFADTPSADTPSADTPSADTPSADTPSADMDTDAKVKQIQNLLTDLVASKAQPDVDDQHIIDLINKHAQKPAAVNVKVQTGTQVTYDAVECMHHHFPLLLSAVSAGVNVMLVGPAGSGKSTGGEKVAEALKLAFYMTGAIDSPYRLSGFIDAQGRVVNTAFRQAFEHGGVFLFDEIDASLPGAVLAFNAALANGYCDFPDGMVKKHADFRAIAAANTYGNGASREYVGRMQQDAAATDRYAMLKWDYDSALEAAILGLPAPANAPKPVEVFPVTDQEVLSAHVQNWFNYVQDIRAKVDELKIRHIVSPRASIHGAKLLAAGWPLEAIRDAVIFKGLDTDSRSKLAA